MNKKNLKKIIFPLITGRNRFCFRNESVSSPLNPMVGMYMIVYEVGIGPIRWMVASEMFPIQFRGISNAISSSTLLTCIFMVGFVFPTIQDILGKYVFLLFGVVSFLSAIYSGVQNMENVKVGILCMSVISI